MVYVCYVAEHIENATDKKETVEEPKSKNLCSCLPWNIFDTVVVDVGPSPGIKAEMEKNDRINYHRIKATAKRLLGTNNVNYEFRLLTGKEPWAAIIDFRKEIGGTMIMMGSRGEGAFKRHIFGSVSDNILKNALVPVLLVKKPQGAMVSVVVENDATAIS